jgi:hypothetical protein
VTRRHFSFTTLLRYVGREVAVWTGVSKGSCSRDELFQLVAVCSSLLVSEGTSESRAKSKGLAELRGWTWTTCTGPQAPSSQTTLAFETRVTGEETGDMLQGMLPLRGHPLKREGEPERGPAADVVVG